MADAAATMLEKRVNRLPVLGARGQLVGIVSRADDTKLEPVPYRLEIR